VRRKLFSFAGMLSMLLCVGAVVMWVRSYWRCDEFEWAKGSVISSRGIVWYWPGLAVGQPEFHSHFYEPARFSGPNYFYFHFAGFAFARGGRMVLLIAVPYWGIALLMALPLWLNFFAGRRKRPKERGCESCGYNLTGNVSGVCPECGAACKASHPAGVMMK
jgi:hypothetical protein